MFYCKKCTHMQQMYCTEQLCGTFVQICIKLLYLFDYFAEQKEIFPEPLWNPWPARAEGPSINDVMLWGGRAVNIIAMTCDVGEGEG